MAKATEYFLVLSTCPDAKCAQTIAHALVERRYAACVNIVPGVQSVYRWKGVVESSDELLLIIKSSTDRYTDIENLIRELHPYELPEVIAVPIDTGLAGFLSWIGAESK